MKLSKGSVDKAIAFIRSEGRPLERALCSYHFDGGPKKLILEQLAKFQNADGGFGNALEPDLRSPESSALCTSFALDILTDLNFPFGEPLIEKAVSFLIETYDRDRHVWRIIPETAEASPHAPWWNKNGLEKRFGNFLAIPRAKICGYLFHYPELTPQDSRNDILERVLAHMEAEEDKVFGDALIGYLFLSQRDNLPADAGARLTSKLERMISVSVETDSTKWGEYCLKPIWTIRSPHSPYYHLIAEAIEKNLDYEIRSQEEDGSWKPFWSWSGSYPQDWQIAQKEWLGIITLHVLRVIEAFRRIENR